MPNGSFLSYKRRRTRKKKSSRVERTKCCRSDSGRFSLCFLLHSFSVQGFEEARAVSRNARVRPAAPPTYSLSVCRSEQASASVRRPARCSPLAVRLHLLCAHRGLYRLDHSSLLMYIYVYFRLLRLPVLASVYVLCVKGPCPCVIFGPA